MHSAAAVVLHSLLWWLLALAMVLPTLPCGRADCEVERSLCCMHLCAQRTALISKLFAQPNGARQQAHISNAHVFAHPLERHAVTPSVLLQELSRT